MRDREECVVYPHCDPVGSALAAPPPPSLPGVTTEMTMATGWFS